MNPPPLSVIQLVLWLVIMSSCCYTWLSSEPFQRFGYKVAGNGPPPLHFLTETAEGAKSSAAERSVSRVKAEQKENAWKMGLPSELFEEDSNIVEIPRSEVRKERGIMATNARGKDFETTEGFKRDAIQNSNELEVSAKIDGDETVPAGKGLKEKLIEGKDGSSEAKILPKEPGVGLQAVGSTAPEETPPAEEPAEKTAEQESAEEPGCFHHPATGLEKVIGDYIRETGCPITFFMFWTTTSDANKTVKSDGFQMRHLRSVESAFVTHPRACVIFLSVLKFENRFMSELQTRGFRLLILDEFDVTSLVKYTPAEVWYKRVDEWRKGKYFFSHFTDLMRLAVLYKFGGVYMDTDCIVMNDVTDVRNTFGAQRRGKRGSHEQVNGAVLMFDRGSSFLYECMVEASGNYHQEKWDYNGPGLLKRMLARTDLEGSYTVVPTMAMYPIFYKDIWRYSSVNGKAKSADEQAAFWARMRNETRVFHWYNQFARKHRAAEGSLMRAAFNEYCIFCEEVVE